MLDTRSPQGSRHKLNRPFIGDPEQSERYAMPPSDPWLSPEIRGVSDGRTEKDRESELDINLPITGAREPPIPSSTTGTRFPVFGYCAIVIRDSTLRFRRFKFNPRISNADLEIRMIID